MVQENHLLLGGFHPPYAHQGTCTFLTGTQNKKINYVMETALFLRQEICFLLKLKSHWSFVFLLHMEKNILKTLFYQSLEESIPKWIQIIRPHTPPNPQCRISIFRAPVILYRWFGINQSHCHIYYLYIHNIDRFHFLPTLHSSTIGIKLMTQSRETHDLS